MASFTLETRPISARPFKLENAKPWDDRGSLAMVGAPLTGRDGVPRSCEPRDLAGATACRTSAGWPKAHESLEPRSQGESQPQILKEEGR